MQSHRWYDTKAWLPFNMVQGTVKGSIVAKLFLRFCDSYYFGATEYLYRNNKYHLINYCTNEFALKNECSANPAPSVIWTTGSPKSTSKHVRLGYLWTSYESICLSVHLSVKQCPIQVHYIYLYRRNFLMLLGMGRSSTLSFLCFKILFI